MIQQKFSRKISYLGKIFRWLKPINRKLSKLKMRLLRSLFLKQKRSDTPPIKPRLRRINYYFLALFDAKLKKKAFLRYFLNFHFYNDNNRAQKSPKLWAQLFAKTAIFSIWGFKLYSYFSNMRGPLPYLSILETCLSMLHDDWSNVLWSKRFLL